ncbi:hypothetical protein TSUD_221480 [Trifolium subterraneum]|uniref:KNOX2 domain-containing protein n=1 Tax=Trifolium subterraneum TaxID=3900 RepID=A0A2Z6MQY6_TRISU|nr:hypothetical protein TSUD_221480 [Trifolium subterraneum]
MEEMYGVPSTVEYGGDKSLITPENLIFPNDYNTFLMSTSSTTRIPMFGSDDIFTTAAEPSSAAIHHDVTTSTVMKSKIASHPYYPRLLQAYIDCQKVGAPPEIARLLEEIRQENDQVKRDVVVSTCFGADPELDEFMETYCDMLVKYKSDLTRPFDEATTFLNKIENQLSHLCTGASVPTASVC